MLREETARSNRNVDFDAFYREQYPRLVRAALLLTADPPEAEDLAQEALSRVYERWDPSRSRP